MKRKKHFKNKNFGFPRVHHQFSGCVEALSEFCVVVSCLSVDYFFALHFVKINLPKRKQCSKSKVKIMVSLSNQKRHIICLIEVIKLKLDLLEAACL
jgi:hypothetical protein